MATIRKVLLADDDADLRRLGQLSLSRIGGFQVIVAATGDVAVELALRELPDLILLDVAMPVMDGKTALAHLRREPKTALIPVIFVTAGVSAGETRALVAAGAVGVVTKPFDVLTLPRQLLAILDAQPSPDASPRAPDALAASPSSGQSNAMFDDLAAQRTAYAAALPARVDVLADALLQARRGDVTSARALAHKLRGSAGAYGLLAVSDAAGRIEDALLLRGERPEPESAWGAVEEALAVLVASLPR